MRSDDRCPPRLKLLALVASGENVPHLEACEECAAFVAAAGEAVTAFKYPGELQQALSEYIDDVLASAPPRHWYSVVPSRPELRHAIVVRDLLRRADEAYGNDSRLALDLTSAAIAVCDAMVASGTPPSADLHFAALKEHALALYRAGYHDQALKVIECAYPIAATTSEPQRDRAILSLCGAIVDAQPDVARFDEAIALAETAAMVLDVHGDERRALMARQTKAQVLMVQNRFSDALPLLRNIALDLEDATGESRDSATANSLLALCLVELGLHEEAIDYATTAERVHMACGDIAEAARASYHRARAAAGLGLFEEVREEFHRAAATLFAAKQFDVWIEMRLNYVAAALAHDSAANVRSELESVVHVCGVLSATESTQRRIFAAEATEYLRQLAARDALTVEAVDHVRAFVARNAARPPVKFVRPLGDLVM